MRSPFRILAASTVAVALSSAVAAMVGCGTADCNDTATCPVGGDGGPPIEGALDATGEAGSGSDALADVSDGAPSAIDAADDTADIAVIPGDGPGDATDAADATVDVDMSDSPLESNPPDATDVGVEAPIDGPPPPMCRSNLLVAKAAFASTQGLMNAASSAIDGNFTTRWESVHNVDPQWIYLDFSAPVFVDRVRILWEVACAANYDIQTSNDAANWTTIQPITGNMLSQRAPTNWNGAADHIGLIGFGRYLRINGTVRCGMLATYGYSIWEMQVYGDTNATCRP